MSTRTIVEINHDYLHELAEWPSAELRRFIESLCGAAPTQPPPGIRVLAQRHHSESITLEVG